MAIRFTLPLGTGRSDATDGASANFLKPIITTASLNIDGRQLAQTIASELAELYENSSASPSANGMAYTDINGGFTAS
jgi:hypothetical protein